MCHLRGGDNKVSSHVPFQFLESRPVTRLNTMGISAAQKAAIEQVFESITSYSVPIGKGRQKRELAAEFMVLPDREVWADYYQVIPEPRCLSGIKNGVEKGDYKNAQQVFSDLNLVFSNALWFNEEQSQVAKDATALKVCLQSIEIC